MTGPAHDVFGDSSVISTLPERLREGVMMLSGLDTMGLRRRPPLVLTGVKTQTSGPPSSTGPSGSGSARRKRFTFSLEKSGKKEGRSLAELRSSSKLTPPAVAARPPP